VYYLQLFSYLVSFYFVSFYFVLLCFISIGFFVICLIVILYLFSYSKCANKRFSVCWLVNVKAVVSLFKQQVDHLAPSHSLRNSHPTGPARGIVASQGTFWVEALAGHNRWFDKYELYEKTECSTYEKSV
jgi:hypothetical protein